MSQMAKSDALSKMMAKATRPVPIRHANLFIGLKMIPPRFLKLWSTTIWWLLTMARTVEVASRCASLSSLFGGRGDLMCDGFFRRSLCAKSSLQVFCQNVYPSCS